MTAAARLRRHAYGGALFLVSACALVLEIVAGRLIAPYAGMSLYTWTAIIAVVLAGLSVGHWIGGRLAAPHVRGALAAQRVAGALALAALTTLATLPLLRGAAGPLLNGGLHPILAIVLLTGVLFLPPSLFAGIVSPIITKLAVDDEPGQAGRVIGRMYALGTAGSILGTLAAGYLFISHIGSTGTVLSVAAAYALLAVAFLAPRPRVAAAVGLIAAIAAGALWWGGGRTTAFASPCRIESDYYCIRVDDFAAESGRPSAVLVLDHLGHGINDRDDPRLLYGSYLHLVDELARLRRGDGRFAAFFIGGGAYTLPRAWLAEHDRPDLLVAEIDPAVTRAAERWLWLEAGAGLEIAHRDARALLQGLPPAPRFDVVLGDAFHDISIPPHLVTREFNDAVADRLKPGGFYAINVVESRREPRFLFAAIRTLQQSFASVEVWVEANELAESERLTYLLVAGARPSPTPEVTASVGLPRRWLRLRDDQVRAKVAASGVPILTDDFAPVDRLLAHVLLSPEIGER